MSKRNKTASAPLLDMWRPPHGAGEPIGCLATTFTFKKSDLFSEHCLARFLGIESEPDREDLAFLLERETRLGGVYAGVLVDYSQAGVEHSLRWDVLPVRIRGGKQHAKLSLLVWQYHIRVIIASANLTEQGYRTNLEVASTLDFSADDENTELLTDTIAFLRSLLVFVPSSREKSPELRRAEEFLSTTEKRAESGSTGKRGRTIRQHLVATVPRVEGGEDARSSLEEALEHCRARGGSPNEVWVASPFYDAEDRAARLTAALCKSMARGEKRRLWFCVPEVRDGNETTVPRLAAPKALYTVPQEYSGTVTVETLPELDGDMNRRPWHAKMLALKNDDYSAVMIGSSNFTGAGLGIDRYRNVEANLLTIVDIEKFDRDSGQLEGVWPTMEEVDDPDSAEWLGMQVGLDDGEMSDAPPMPPGFLYATYRAGVNSRIVLHFIPTELPDDWSISATGNDKRDLLSVQAWRDGGAAPQVEISWGLPQTQVQRFGYGRKNRSQPTVPLTQILTHQHLLTLTRYIAMTCRPPSCTACGGARASSPNYV